MEQLTFNNTHVYVYFTQIPKAAEVLLNNPDSSKQMAKLSSFDFLLKH